MIVCGRDLTFTSQFWIELFHLQGTSFNFSSTNHPQTDGQIEVVSWTLKMYLRCLTRVKPKDWVPQVPWVEYCYNTSQHLATNITPFEAIYGIPPPNLLSYVPRTTRSPEVDKVLCARDRTLELLRTNLAIAQNCMKQVYEKRHTNKELAVGDWVYHKL